MEMVDMEVELVMNMDKETGTKDERNRSTTSPAMMIISTSNQLLIVTIIIIMMTLPTSTSSIITYLTNASILTSSDDEGSKEHDATKRVSSNKQKYSTTLNAMQGLIMKKHYRSKSTQ